MKIVQDFGFEVAKNTHPAENENCKIVQDFGSELAKNIPQNENCSELCIWPCQEYPSKNEKISGFWIWACQEYPPPPLKMKIVQDFGFELAKNTHPAENENCKIVQDFGFELAKNIPQNENCSELCIWPCQEYPSKNEKISGFWIWACQEYPPENENCSGLWIWGCQENTPLPHENCSGVWIRKDCVEALNTGTVYKEEIIFSWPVFTGKVYRLNRNTTNWTVSRINNSMNKLNPSYMEGNQRENVYFLSWKAMGNFPEPGCWNTLSQGKSWKVFTY